MRSNKLALVIILIFSFFLTGCGKSSESDQFVTKDSFMMGTLVTVKVFGPKRDEAAQKVLDEIKRLENLMSINIEESEISQINANAGQKPVKVSDDTFIVISGALEYAEMTDGLFDPSIGPLVKLWGIGTHNAKVPTQEELEKALTLVNYKDVILNKREQTVYLKKAGMIIDVGGIAKGYAADQAIDIFKKHQIKNGFLNIGGNVIVHGPKPNNELWRIGIQDPRAVRDEIMAVASLQDQAVVTSGDYERYIIRDGKRYHHILNPKTGYPVDRGLMSASMVGTSSFHADALSTSVFLLGQEEGMKLAKDKGFDVMLITKDQQVIMSEGLKGQMQIINKEYQQ